MRPLCWCGVAFSRGVLLLCVGLLMFTGPGAGLEASEQVDWPADLDRPYRERVAALESALGIEVDYWYSRADKGLGNWVQSFGDERPTRFESHYDDAAGTFRITILRGDSTVSWVTATASLVEVPGMGATGIFCVNGDCIEEPPRTRVTTQVAARDLPVGVEFGHHNHIKIEAPLGTFDHYGRGIEAIEGLAKDLGLPVERFDWEAARFVDQNLTGMTVWRALPEIGRIGCDCVMVRLGEGSIFGANVLQVVMESERIIQFSSNPWLLEGLEPKVSRIEAEAIAREFSAKLGYDHWIPKKGSASNTTAVQSDHFVYAVFLPDSGLAWRFQAHVQGPTKSASMEVFVDAMTGEVEHEAVYPTSKGGYNADTLAPSISAVATVVLVAFLLIRRW
jgi:hypothetical protein